MAHRKVRRRKLPVYPVPEAITSEDWDIQEGGGSVEINVSGRNRKMRVPLIDSPGARHIRAHEMAHAKYSPANPVLPKLPNPAIQRAEDMRMNLYCRRMGLDEAMDAPLMVTEEAIDSLVRNPLQSGDILGPVTAASATYRTGDWPTVIEAIRCFDPLLADRVENFIPTLWEYLESRGNPTWDDAMRNAQALVDFCKSPDNPNPEPGEGESGKPDDSTEEGSDTEGTGSGSDESDTGDDSEGDSEGPSGDPEGNSDDGEGSGSGEDSGESEGSDGQTGNPDDSDDSGDEESGPHSGWGGADDFDSEIDQAIRDEDEAERDEDRSQDADGISCEEAYRRHWQQAYGNKEEGDKYFDRWLEETKDQAVKWAPMQIIRKPLTERLPGSKLKGRAKVATDTGRVPRYMGRYCTDRSIFEGSGQRKGGGAILIDGSSSLSLSDEEIDQILTECPAATIAVYNGIYSRGELWIITRYGKRLAHGQPLKPQFHANAVDGPALQWLSKIKGEKYWVCDGLVNNGSESGANYLRECDAMCEKHRIMRVGTIRSLIEAIR